MRPSSVPRGLPAGLLPVFVLAALTVATNAAPAAAQTGSVTGVVVTTAQVRRPLRITTDMRVCGTSLPDESIVVGPGNTLANVVLTLTGLKAGSAPAEIPVVNEKCRFTPRVQLLRPKGVVKATSRDPLLHTTNAQMDGSATVLFNVGLPAPGLTVSKTLAAPGLVRISCNSHTWMRGWVVVTDEAAAVTGLDGTFTIPNVPPGTYTLTVWHETLKAAARKITVTAGKAATVSISM